MVKIKNIVGDEYSGAAGDARVYAKWKGIQYGRKYVIPANPRTIKQQNIRSKFTNAVNFWHTWNSIQQSVYRFLASGQPLTGFNLLVSRWQKAAPPTVPYPTAPLWGMIQVASQHTAVTNESVSNSQGPSNFGKKPVEILTVNWNKGSSTLDINAYVYCDAGLVEVKKDITGVLKVSYTAGGKTIVKEEVATNPTTGSKYHLKNFGLTITSVKVYVGDTEVDGIAIDLANGQYYFTKAAPGVNDSKMNYYALTDAAGTKKALEAVKLETYFANTSNVAFRAYSNANGAMLIGATTEDELYDLRIEYPGYTTVLEAGRSASQIVADRCYILS
jgi:hypothetical protein